MADGMRTASIGVLPFAHLHRHLDGVLTVEEHEIPVAMARAAREARMVLEPSGATTLAALIHRSDELPATGRVVCVLSGGNVDPERYAELIDQGGAALE
jgi:threonine dehydratase